MEESPFPPGQGTFPKHWVQFWGKVAAAAYIPPFFGHGRVEVGVDQSAVSVSCCSKVGTQLCHVLTREYPVLLFILFSERGERFCRRCLFDVAFFLLTSVGSTAFSV